MKKTDLNYWAGFIDGEGSLKHYCRPKKNLKGKIYDCYVPVLEVTNTDLELIKQMYKDFNLGYIYFDKPRLTAIGNKCKPIARWKVQYQELYSILKTIGPYFRCKAKQKISAEIIQYYEKRKIKPEIRAI